MIEGVLKPVAVFLVWVGLMLFGINLISRIHVHYNSICGDRACPSIHDEGIILTAYVLVASLAVGGFLAKYWLKQ